MIILLYPLYFHSNYLLVIIIIIAIIINLIKNFKLINFFLNPESQKIFLHKNLS